MVYFSCSGCNESLKKNKVANHLSFCRRCSFLTCLDCQKDFDSESYTRHNQCITEVERYGGPGYVLPDNANKGQKKQMGWMDSVRLNIDAFLEETKSMKHKKDEQIIMTGLQKYDNIPRKKAKFVNFIKSSFARYRYNVPLIESAWNVISAIKSEDEDKATPVNEEPALKEQPETNGQEDKDETKRKKKKSKKDEFEDDNNSSEMNGDSGDKKKKKKRKNQDEEIEQCVDEEETKSKKKKKKKRKMKEEEDEEETFEEESGSSRRKRKKKRKMEVEEDEETESRKKKERKRDVEEEEKMNESGNSNIESEVEEGDAEEVEDYDGTVTKDLDHNDSNSDNRKRTCDDKENEGETSMNGGTAGSDEDTSSRKKKKKKKKRKRKERDLEDNSDEAEDVTPPVKRPKTEHVPEGFQQQRLNETLELKTPQKFSISNVINSVLEKNGEDGISMKKLEKKVLSEYQVSLKEGQPFRPHKISSKLKTVVSKHFRLVNDRVFLRPEF